MREAVTIDQLRAFSRERLPDHMIPAAFVVLDELPITANGKLDRRALPAPETARLGPVDSYVAPRNETEELLAGIWADVLDLERVGVTDGFFVLGGDSIRSVRVLAKARERGLEFSLQQLFRHQTIAELAREIAMAETPSLPMQETKPFELISEADRDKLPPGVVDAYPLTMMQGGMFFHMALSPDTSVYHNVNGWHLRAPFDPQCFEEAVARAVARHPILRTSFDLTSYSEPLQLVHESATLQVGVTDLRQYSEEEQSELLDQYVEIERSHLFDLGCPPLLRFHIHLRTAESFQFTLTESHPIFDGWSLNSTLAEIFTNYFTLLKEHALPPIVPVSITFRDFVALERQALQSEEYRNFWEEKLRGMKVTRLPRLPESYRQTGDKRIRDEHNQLPIELCRDIDAVARSLKVPIKTVLLAAHQKVLSLLSGETDVVTGFVMNGRPEARDGEEVRGMFLNTVPFRLGISDGTWADLILSTFHAESELLPYRRYPLLALQRQMGGQQLFEAQFTFIRFHVLAGVLSSGDVEVLPDVKRRASEETHFLLSADFAQSPLSSQLNLLLQYDSAELSPEQVQAIGGYYIETLRRIAADPAERHNARTSITPAERHRLLSEWNDNAHAHSRAACLHELLKAQESNEPANELAHFLQSAANTRIYILNEQMEPVPVGATGELYVGGEDLARGYHDLPDLTAERYIPDPFAEEAGARVYRTGELARYLPDGLVELLGRVDSQLKLRAVPLNGEQPAAPAVFVAPRNELERTLAQIWCEVLGVEQIGIHDNFFDLGGHSLRLLQMHLKIRETMQRELPLFELFQYPTVNALANHLRTGGDGESLEPSEQRGERRKKSSAQQRERRHNLRATV
jgi:aryl carrier-like protein